MNTADGYDAIPYDSVAFPESHPSRLGGMARLCGFPASIPDQSRILELGCASGGNLVPMAASLPAAECVGVDFSERQIAAGRDWLKGLGLGNCTLLCGDINAVSLEGEFDYIIAHGVYSWVDREPRDSLLTLIENKLAPSGVAYVSFNTLPGWYTRSVLRDFLLFYRRSAGLAEGDFSGLRTAFESLASQTPAPDSTYGRMLQESLKKLQSHNDSYLAHEHLEPTNEAVYFTEFAEHAARHGLAYVGEARTLEGAGQGGDIGDMPAAAGEIERQQYLDFLAGTQFRRAILCRAGAELGCDKQALASLYYGCVSAMQVRVAADGKTEFAFDGGKAYFPPGPACECLKQLAAAWPEYRSAEQLGASHDDLQAWTRAGILVPRLGGHAGPSRASGERPLVAPLAREQAGSGRAVTNLRHENVQLGPFQRQLVPLLDGSRDAEALSQWIAGLIKDGTMKVNHPDAGEDVSAQLLAAQLRVLAGMGLLVDPGS